MKNINNIDELLKNSFSNFEATPPPDAWNGIQHGLTHAGTGGTENIAHHAATVVKSAGILSKVALVALTSGMVIGGAYLGYKYFNKSTHTGSKIVVQQNQIPQINEQKQVETLPEQNPSSIKETTKAISITLQKESKKSNPIRVGKTNPVMTGNENETAPVVTPNPMANTPKTVVAQAPKAKQKLILPKVNHEAVAPEKSSSSNTTMNDENDDAKPEIANVITPDGDGLNDKFEIKINNETFYDLKIYDKEQHLVFESDNKEREWDGTKMNMGERCEDRTYTYSFSFRYKNSEKVHSMKGTISMLR